MLKELADKIEKLVNEKVEPEIIGHEGVDYVKTASGFIRLHKPSTNGIGQTVTAKQGTSMNRNFQVQPIVKLKPIRTYAEIEQVESTLFNIKEADKETGVVMNKLQEITNVAVWQLNIDGEIQEAQEPIYIGDIK